VLRLSESTVAGGDPIALRARVANAGNAPLAGVVMRVALRDAATLALADERTFTLALAAGAAAEQEVSFASAALPVGSYRVELSADVAQPSAHRELAAELVAVSDTGLPQVAIRFPANGQVLRSHGLAARAEASDAQTGIARVEFRVDGGPFRS